MACSRTPCAAAGGCSLEEGGELRRQRATWAKRRLEEAIRRATVEDGAGIPLQRGADDQQQAASRCFA